MHAVELVEAGDPASGDAAEPGAGGPGRPAAGRGAAARFVRRHRVRLVAVLAVGVLALGLGAVRDSRADRARTAALAAAPGVLDRVEPRDGVLERWRRPVLDVLVASGGLVVTSGVGADGRGRVAAYDASTGAPRWDVPVAGVGPQGELTCVVTGPPAGGAAAPDARGTAPGSGTSADTGGAPAAGDAPVVACVAVPAVGKEAWGGLGRRGEVRLVVLDAATGERVRDDPADRSDLQLATLGPDLVLTRTLPGGDVRVTRETARSGADAWTVEGDARAPGARGPQPAVTRVERGQLRVDGGALLVLDASGARVQGPLGADALDVPLSPAADDGSDPDLVLVARPATGGAGGADALLSALDAPAATPAAARDADATGASAEERTRWSAGVPAGSVLVVDGRVVTSDATGALTARDAAQGDVLWSADATAWLGARAAATLGDPLTDGVHVLVPLLLADGTPVLVAVDPVDGRAAWSSPLPADVRSVERAGRRLLGRTATEVVGLGQG